MRERKRERETDRQTDRQADRQRERERKRPALVLDSVTLIASFPHGHAPACFRINDSNNLFSDESQVLKRLKSTVGTM